MLFCLEVASYLGVAKVAFESVFVKGKKKVRLVQVLVSDGASPLAFDLIDSRRFLDSWSAFK